MEVRSLVLTDHVHVYEKGNANVTGRRAFKFHLPGRDLQCRSPCLRTFCIHSHLALAWRAIQTSIR